MRQGTVWPTDKNVSEKPAAPIFSSLSLSLSLSLPLSLSLSSSMQTEAEDPSETSVCLYQANRQHDAISQKAFNAFVRRVA